MKSVVWQVDAFASRPFTGNPAAICALERWPEDSWMQAVAAEMNLAETAFLVPGNEAFQLRWFTPVVEVDLCGHATLGSAHFLWESGRLAPATVARFQTRSGLLTAEQAGTGWIALDFPATPVAEAPTPPGLVEALGAEPVWCGRSRFDVVVELDSDEAVRTLTPDIRALARVKARGVVVTARATTGDADFVSRFFAPASGVDEDPVTGSAHCALAPFWAERLGKAAMTGYQASRRGGTVRVELRGDRVRLEGQAVTVFKGELTAPPG